MWSILSGNFHAPNERALQVRFLIECEERKSPRAVRNVKRRSVSQAILSEA